MWLLGETGTRQSRNVLAEVTAAGKARSVPVFAAELYVKFTENFGQVSVSNVADNKPLSMVYVRLADGSVKFHTDGYADVNTPERSPVQRVRRPPTL